MTKRVIFCGIGSSRSRVPAGRKMLKKFSIAAARITQTFSTSSFFESMVTTIELATTGSQCAI